MKISSIGTATNLKLVTRELPGEKIYGFLKALDILLSRQEYEHISWWFIRMDLEERSHSSVRVI